VRFLLGARLVPRRGTKSPAERGQGVDVTHCEMKADPSNYWAYNKTLQPVANKLRHRMTHAEVVIWTELLRASKMKGYPFRRQRPILGFVVDFMCKNLNLVIEVDGESHAWPGAPERDAWRQRLIEEAGFTVIRFGNEEVLTNLGAVQLAIEAAIAEIEERGGIVIPKRERKARRHRKPSSPQAPSGEGELLPPAEDSSRAG